MRWPPERVVALALLLLLWVCAGVQLADDLGDTPATTSAADLPITLSELASPPADAQVCWPASGQLADELPELVGVRSTGLPPCPPDAASVVIERTDVGQFRYVPGQRLVLETW